MSTALIIAVVTSSAVIVWVVKTATDSLVKWLNGSGMKWKPYAGYAVAAVKAAESIIPDNTPNKGLAKLDLATHTFVRHYEEASGEAVTRVDVAQIQALIEEVLQQLKQSGAIKGGTL